MPGCAHPAAVPQAHRWPPEVDVGTPGPSRSYSQLSLLLERSLGPLILTVGVGPGGGRGAGPRLEEGLFARAPGFLLFHPPTHLQRIYLGDAGQASLPGCIPLPDLLIGRASALCVFLFLLAHQGKFGIIQGKVGPRLGMHFAGGDRAGEFSQVSGWQVDPG